MKKNPILFIWAAFVLATLLVSCTKTDAVVEAIDEDAALISPLTLPEGARVTRQTDNESVIELPEDVFYVAKDLSEGSVLMLSTLSVRCQNTEGGGGCNPALRDGEYGCLMTSTCSTCKKTTTTSTLDPKTVEVLGIVDFNKGASFITDMPSGDPIVDAFTSTRTEAYGNAFAEFFELPRVQEGIMEIYDMAYAGKVPDFILRNEEAPAGYSYIAMNLFGQIAALPFPSEQVAEQLESMQRAEHFEGRITCKCHAGTGCAKKTAALSIQYCDAGNSTDCELKD